VRHVIRLLLLLIASIGLDVNAKALHRSFIKLLLTDWVIDQPIIGLLYALLKPTLGGISARYFEGLLCIPKVRYSGDSVTLPTK
jgi:hypothetical protein